MTIEEQLHQLLKDSMRARDARTSNVVRMLKTKHMEKRTEKGFDKPLDDALWLEVIAAYQKQMKKSREEFVKAGDRGGEAIEELDFEIAFCGRFLPTMASEDEVRAAVKEALSASGVTDPKQAGRVMGDIMKTNKGKFDPAMVKDILAQELNG